MGKTQRQNTKAVKIVREGDQTKKKSGRPSNDRIETAFLNTIRDVKLQAINAQAELQLEMAFFTNEDEKKSRRKEQSSVSEKWVKIFQFNSLMSEQKKTLHQNFDKCVQGWKFEQIEEQSDFPEYFFDDSNDLAYILHEIKKFRNEAVQVHNSIQKSPKKQNKSHKIRAEEIFYLCLLCFNSQESLRDVVLQFLLKNQNLIINLLKASMEKARIKYIQKVRISKQNHKSTDQNQTHNILKSQEALNNQSHHQLSQYSKLTAQKKKIQKPFKKNNQNNDNLIDSGDSQEPMTQKEKQEKLIICFVNYISWSYFYVYVEEHKPMKVLDKQGQKIAETDKTS